MRRISLIAIAVVAMVVSLLSAGLERPAAAQDAGDSGPAKRDEPSVARVWNEALLQAIRWDFARPVVHARNLFHASAGMYDLWTVFDGEAAPFLLDHPLAAEVCALSADEAASFRALPDHNAALHEAISWFNYVMLSDRFANTPSGPVTPSMFREVMVDLGYEPPAGATTIGDVELTAGDAASLGWHMAACVVAFGAVDGANEAWDFANVNYEPQNPGMWPAFAMTEPLADPDRWQPLLFDVFIDQSGNVQAAPEFLGAEWGRVEPFALPDAALDVRERDGAEWWVWLDPGPPPLLADPASAADYVWGHTLVAEWSAQLDPADGVMIDISPGSRGNLVLPDADRGLGTLREMYGAGAGVSRGDAAALLGPGHDTNPATGAPYETNLVPQGDWTRVLAEFWADGPDSETPPGHWFSILNELVVDHPDAHRRWMGEGPALSPLEWDIKAYMTLGGAMQDAAVSAWSVKGWYDYVRPISAVRHMAAVGQSSEPEAPDHHPNGLPLIDGRIERIAADDPLAGPDGAHVGELKLWAWAGPDRGVDWIRAATWVPYQQPSFVTPPFAGYVSGHSTFSRAAAEVLTAITGSAYFPGGMGEFVAEANAFLEFEQGPSVDVRLQWATYRDAADQTSLSRIWGGIHPPADDLPGRHMGIEVGTGAVAAAQRLFAGEALEHTRVSATPRPAQEPPGRGSRPADDGEAGVSAGAELADDSTGGGWVGIAVPVVAGLAVFALVFSVLRRRLLRER